jgi:hypothetical protein
MDLRVLVSYSIFASVLSMVSVSGFLLDVSLIVKVSPTFKGSATQTLGKLMITAGLGNSGDFSRREGDNWGDETLSSTKEVIPSLYL